MACYVLTNYILKQHNLYKFGMTTQNSLKLRSTYQRYIIRPEVILFYETKDYKRDEKNILEHFSKSRLDHWSGQKSEWLEIEYSGLKEFLDEYFRHKKELMDIL